MIVLDEYTPCPVRVWLLCGEEEIGVATAFFFKNEEQIALVSNWHVFSGRNTYTGQALRPDAALPDKIRFGLHLKNKPGRVLENIVLPLMGSNGESLWFQHKNGQDIDVAILRLPQAPEHVAGQTTEELLIQELPRLSETQNMKVTVGQDVFILGFPKSVSHNKYLPIWKRGSIATEPDLPHDDDPVFLVDTATREGMSGAPVLLRSTGVLITDDGSVGLGTGTYTRFLGVYSGRFGADDELSAQLGRVWHRRVIQEILVDGVPGNYELRKQNT